MIVCRQREVGLGLVLYATIVGKMMLYISIVIDDEWLVSYFRCLIDLESGGLTSNRYANAGNNQRGSLY